MDINIPGPINPAYFANISFNFANKSDRLRDVGNGRAKVVTDVALARKPRGRPVWNHVGHVDMKRRHRSDGSRGSGDNYTVDGSEAQCRETLDEGVG